MRDYGGLATLTGVVWVIMEDLGQRSWFKTEIAAGGAIHGASKRTIRRDRQTNVASMTSNWN